MAQQVIVNLFAGLSPLCISFNSDTLVTVQDLKSVICTRTQIPSNDQRLATLSGRPLYDEAPLFQDECEFLTVNLKLCLAGGKGGFGSMLRAQGGKMASQKTTNFEACRDLNGRRLRTINEAKKLADYLEKEPERQRAKKDKIIKKIEQGMKEPPVKKYRFDDTQFVNESQEIIQDVKNSVTQAMKAKKGLAQKPTEKKTVSASMSMWDVEMSDVDSSQASGDDDDNNDTKSESEGEDIEMTDSAHESEDDEADTSTAHVSKPNNEQKESTSNNKSTKDLKGKGKEVADIKGKGNAIFSRKRKARDGNDEE